MEFYMTLFLAVNVQRTIGSSLLGAALTFLPITSLHAQITNGTFGDSLNGWTKSNVDWMNNYLENRFVSRPSDGNPSPSASLGSACPTRIWERGCLEQTLVCGDSVSADSCIISFDYRLDYRPCISSNVHYKADAAVDDVVLWQTDLFGARNTSWSRVTFAISPGTHTLSICGYVRNGAILRFDNFEVSSRGQIATQPATWGGIKTLYH
jgi:hypothetical protein